MMRKIIVLFLSSSLLFAGFDVKDYFGGFSNATPVQSSWDVNEGSLITGGNYEYRYQFNGNLKPLFSAKAPSVKIGCGSMSVDGGFLAFLGLNDIETQFTDASAAFAFGFMSALELTMPEIAAIIHKLQQWARMLQQLLGDACNSGKRAGEFMKNLWSSQATGQENFIGITMNPNEKASKFEESINGLPPSADKAPATEGKKKDIISKIKRSSGGASMMLSIFGNNLPERDKANPDDTLVVLDANLKDFLESKKLGTKNLEDASSDVFKEKVTVYLLTKILFGDVYANKTTVEYLRRYFKDGKVDLNALKQDMKLKIYEDGDTSEQSFKGGGFFKGTPYGPDEVASALMYGFDRIGGTNNEINIPNNDLMYIDAKISTGASGEVSNSTDSNTSTVSDSDTADVNATLTVKTFLVLDSKKGTFPIKWEGFYTGSEEAIWAKINGDSVISWSSIQVPNAVPGMGRYIKILRTLYAKNNSSLVVHTLVKSLADLNSYYVSIAFISEVESIIRYHKNNAKVSLSSDGVNLMRDNLDKLSIRVKKIKKAMAKKIPKLSSMPSVNKDFEMLDKEIMKNISKAVGE